MAVIHGSKADAYMNGYRVASYANEIKQSSAADTHDVTVFDNDGAKIYTKGIRGASISVSGFFDHDNSANLASETPARVDADTLEYLLNTAIGNQSTEDCLLAFQQGSTAVGNRGVAITGFTKSYDIDSSITDITKSSWDIDACHGRERIRLLSVPAVQTNTFTGTTFDFGSVQTGTGGAVFLQVMDHTSGTLPAIIEHSTNGTVWSTLATFANVTADHSFERIAISGTINRYVRVAATGTFVSELVAAIHRKA